MLPTDRADTIIRLRGTTLRARWNARRGPPERSGTLSVRGMLDGLVKANEILTITITIGEDGRIRSRDERPTTGPRFLRWTCGEKEPVVAAAPALTPALRHAGSCA